MEEKPVNPEQIYVEVDPNQGHPVIEYGNQAQYGLPNQPGTLVNIDPTTGQPIAPGYQAQPQYPQNTVPIQQPTYPPTQPMYPGFQDPNQYGVSN